MRIVYTVVFILTVILSSIELSSQFECLPNGDPIPGVPCGSSSSSFFDTQDLPASSHPPASSNPPARPHSPLRSPSPAEALQRARSRSPSTRHIDPPTRLPSSDEHGYKLDQLQFIRLTPIKNPHRQFELRRYAFPTDKRIKLFAGYNVFLPMPPQEQIVLSTLDGDVFAILTSNNILAGLYRHNAQIKRTGRVKINMESGKITPLTTDETEEVRVGQSCPIQFNFRVEHINHNYGSSSADPRLPATSRSRPAIQFSHVLGYGLDQLQFIRLCSNKNPHRLFELRRYTFPADKPIKILSGRHRFFPIPIQEQIVLSTFGGDVFAIFESSNVLTGIYTHKPRAKSEKRAKINMESGTITLLTPDEIRETPVGPNRLIDYNYVVERVNQNPPQ